MVAKEKYADAMEAGARQLHELGLHFQDKTLKKYPMAGMLFDDKMGPSLALLETGRQEANDAEDAVDLGDGYEETCLVADKYAELVQELYSAYELFHGKFPQSPLVEDLKDLTEASYSFLRLIVKPLCKALKPENTPILPFDPDIFFWEDYGESHWEVSSTNPHTGVVGFRWGNDEVQEVDIGASHFPIQTIMEAARKSSNQQGDLYVFLPGGEYEGASLAHDDNWRDAPTYNCGWVPRDRKIILCGNGISDPTWLREAGTTSYGQTLGLYGDREYLVYDLNLIASRDNALNIGKYGNFDPNLRTCVRWVRGRMVGPRGNYLVVRPVSANSCSVVFFGTYFNFGEKAQEHVFYYRNPCGDCGMVDCFCDHYGAQRIQAVCRKSEGILFPGALNSTLLSIRSFGINGTRYPDRAANIGVSAQGSCQNVLISGGADLDVPEAHIGANEKGVHGICNFTSGGTSKSHARPSGKGQGTVVIQGDYVGANVGHNRPPIQGDSAEKIIMEDMGVWGLVQGSTNQSRALEFTSGVSQFEIRSCNSNALRSQMLEYGARFGLPGLDRSVDPPVRRMGKTLGTVSELDHSES